jgi:hypothetical protein
MAEQGRRPVLFIQVNTGQEPQKAGIAPGEAEEVGKGRLVGRSQDKGKRAEGHAVAEGRGRLI